MTTVLDSVPLIVPYSSGSSLPWTTKDRFFLENGIVTRWKGFSAFKLLNLFESGKDIRSFLEYYDNFNIARVWTSVSWNDRGWDFPSNEATLDFLEFMQNQGFKVELTLTTDSRTDRAAQVNNLVQFLEKQDITNLLLEAVNEPFIHDKLDPSVFKNLLNNSKFLYTSGIYTDNKKFYGKYWVDHSSRDGEWFRKGGHNLYEAYEGGGPNSSDEPALRMPGVEDEPGKLQDFGTDLLGIYSYAASCGLLGAGATVHTETGKYCDLPTDDELNWIAMFNRGLDVFPVTAASGSYRRITEENQPSYARTYVVGNYSIRIKQLTREHPEQGWIPLDEFGICWKRA